MAKTGNVSLDGVQEHRKRYGAKYALVVAPGFEEGAISVRCEQVGVTPMRAADLGRLLEYTVTYGAIPLDTLEEVFTLRDPKAVSTWVTALEEKLKSKRKLTIDVFLKALNELRGKVPDALQASLVSFTCRDRLGVATVRDEDVIRLVRGLQILVPDLVGLDENERIIVNASAERVAAAVAAQLDKLHADADVDGLGGGKRTVTATVHPFPARMAPELALEALKNVPVRGTIVDPMMGSGTVIRQATEVGLSAIGFDMDPLAVLMSRVWTTPVSDEAIARIYSRAAEIALAADPADVKLPWIDADPETADFISYWFGRPQVAALRCWAGAITDLAMDISADDAAALDVLRIAMSRIIVTKEQCASLARDTSHSRPHRVTLATDYCVHQGMSRSLKMVRNRLLKSPPKQGASVALGDARAMSIAPQSVDAVLTSPPYLNAIDYLRGHRMSLVWLGHKLSELRSIRSDSIGAERRPDTGTLINAEVKDALGDLNGLPIRYQAMVDRYVADVARLAAEVKRVLKPGGIATMVVGNSTLKGVFIKNSAAVSRALELQGLEFVSETVRDLPNQNRYLPTAAGSSLANRMREETVIKWAA